MPVLNLLPCIDANICTFGLAMPPWNWSAEKCLFHVKGGQEWPKIKVERLDLYFGGCVCLCWLEEFMKLWSRISKSC